jgi:integrase
MQFGEFPHLSPARARSIAAELAARVKLGEDPAAEKKVRRAEAAHTFGRVVEAYLEQKRDVLRPKSYNGIERYLSTYAKPLHNLPATAVDLKKIAVHLDTIAKEHGPVSANRARAALSAMFTWAMRRGLHNSNPVALTEERPEQSRDRVLTDDELALIWNAVGDGEYGIVVKLLILSGQRIGEIGGLRWSEINFARGEISLPAERVKNNTAHTVPLSDAALGILRGRSRDGDNVFGRSARGFVGWGKGKTRLDQALTAKLGRPLPAWTLHDLRRTFATGLQRLGVRLEVTEACLNHISGSRGGIKGIYQRHDWAGEKATAMARWADHVMNVVAGRKSNITPMRRGA